MPSPLTSRVTAVSLVMLLTVSYTHVTGAPTNYTTVEWTSTDIVTALKTNLLDVTTSVSVTASTTVDNDATLTTIPLSNDKTTSSVNTMTTATTNNDTTSSVNTTATATTSRGHTTMDANTAPDGTTSSANIPTVKITTTVSSKITSGAITPTLASTTTESTTSVTTPAASTTKKVPTTNRSSVTMTRTPDADSTSADNHSSTTESTSTARSTTSGAINENATDEIKTTEMEATVATEFETENSEETSVAPTTQSKAPTEVFPSNSPEKLSGGAIAGIVIGSVVGAALIVGGSAGAYIYFTSKKTVQPISDDPMELKSYADEDQDNLINGKQSPLAAGSPVPGVSSPPPIDEAHVNEGMDVL